MSLTNKTPGDFSEKSVSPEALAKAKSNIVDPDKFSLMVNDAVKHFYIPIDKSREEEVIGRAKEVSRQIARVCREVASRDRMQSGNGLVDQDAMRGLLRRLYRDNFRKEFTAEELLLIICEVHVEVALSELR